MKSLLLIIDPQNDFTHINGRYAMNHGITQILKVKANINLLLSSFKHPKAIVIADYHHGQFEEGVSLAVPSTFGHQIDAEIVLPNDIPVWTKSEHSCLTSKDFSDALTEMKINTILICGFLAEYCVKQTALDALKLGYDITMVKDCIGTGDDVQHRREHLFEEIKGLGGKVLTMHECLKLS
jgi:nicotinamidase-related amidase